MNDNTPVIDLTPHDCYLPVGLNAYTESLIEILIELGYIEKKTGMIVLTVEEFNKAIEDAKFRAFSEGYVQGEKQGKIPF